MSQRKTITPRTKTKKPLKDTDLAAPPADPPSDSSAPSDPSPEPQPSTHPAPSGKGTHAFPILGIGSSAGGLEALEALFRAMPVDSGMAFVVVSHLHPGHVSMLPELLGKATAMPVMEAEDGVQVLPNRVYVAPAGGGLAIYKGHLRRMDASAIQSPHLPIDYFFRSLAADQNENAICIILSGTGTDGTLGLREIKAELGLVMVQKADSAKFSGMPGSAIGTGLADFILSPQEMPQHLIAYSNGPRISVAKAEDRAPEVEPLQKLFLLIRARTGHDFSGYKVNTIRRRVDRRMNLHQIKITAAYVRFLQDNPHEVDILFRELLISVTSFFRDPEAFESLAKDALTELIKSRPDVSTLRVWVPGCATGEEVYSLAILLREGLESLKRPLDVQLFGTDLDSEAIEVARAGLYPDGIATDITPHRLERFFTREGNLYRIRKDIREMAVFAVQNVIKDAPFTRLDLISCRNLLIYLNADVQKRLLPLFHYALRPGGLLLLGPSETLGGSHDLFETIDKRWKIYRRKESAQSTSSVLEFTNASWRDHRDPRPAGNLTVPKDNNITTSVERLLISRFAPASVVVNDRGDALFFHGRTGAYLEPAVGRPRLNILDMAREGLQLDLSTALRHAATQSGEVVRELVRVRTNGDFTDVNLHVVRIQEPESLRGLFLVTFWPAVIAPKSKKLSRIPGKMELPEKAALERELQATKESLQTTVEEFETSNEELKSTNEELQSTNEELQSANEELETSKEEMQSLNEELSTVNAELQSKVDELSRANNDMQNLLNSIHIATIFLDRQLKITRYTEQAKRLVNLIESDVGRPLADLASNLNYQQMADECREVLRTSIFKETEVETRQGQSFLLRIMPYRTAEKIIDGLVLTFVDLNPVKQAQIDLRRMSKVFTDAQDPIVIVDFEGRIVDLNDEVVRTYGWTRHDLVGQPLTMMVAASGRELLERRLERCRKGESLRAVECPGVDKSGREYRGLLTLSLLTDQGGAPEAISITMQHAAD